MMKRKWVKEINHLLRRERGSRETIIAGREENEQQKQSVMPKKGKMAIAGGVEERERDDQLLTMEMDEKRKEKSKVV